MSDYGLREDGTPKGEGWLGPLEREDGEVSTELSTSIDFGNGDVLLPLLVPTLSQEEIDLLLKGDKPTEEIYHKAGDHALERLKKGLSPFKD